MKEEKIYFSRENLRWENGKVIITIHEHLEDGTINIVKVDENGYSKYQKTIDLMEELKIIRISKNKGNISYKFNTTLRLSQDIVKLTDEEYYAKYGYRITYKESLGNDWYYIETK